LVGTIFGQYFHGWSNYIAKGLRRNKTQRNVHWESTEFVQGQSTTNNLTVTVKKKGPESKRIEAKESAWPKGPALWKKDRQLDNMEIQEMTDVEIRCQLTATVEIVTTRTQK
jgi:hypothetical protein